jgi:hypothetical protein
MNSLSLYLDLDQGVKQEQYKDLLREAGHYRLVKAVAQPGSEGLKKVAALLRRAMFGSTQHLSSPRPTNHARI